MEGGSRRVSRKKGRQTETENDNDDNDYDVIDVDGNRFVVAVAGPSEVTNVIVCRKAR